MTRKKSRPVQIELKNTMETSLERYHELMTPADFSSLLHELEKPLLGAMRINPLKAGLNDLQEWEDRYGWETRPVPFCPLGFWLTSKKINPGSTLEHRMGDFYLQDAASMLPVELFDLNPVDQPIILDLAASPGGKTTQIIGRTMDHGLVIANDSSQGRIAALKAVLQTWGAINFAITCLSGEWYGTMYPDKFDAVLLDAPCSMDGLRATESHPLRPITEKERTSLARRQILLLKSALQAVRPGGQVVYSTCTLAPEEDEAVLDELLRNYPDSIQIDDVSERKHIQATGLTHNGDIQYQPDVGKSLRLWPHTFGTAGFFAARLTKTGRIFPEKPDIGKSKSVQNSFSPRSKVKSREIHGFILDEYGYDILPLIEGQELEIMQIGKSFFLIPRLISEFLPQLKFRSVGMGLVNDGPEGFEITHEFVSRFGRLFNHGILTLAEDLKGAWLRGEDLRKSGLPVLNQTRILAVRDENGRNLGRGRVTSDRLKNLLPRKIIL
jgi:16S rRNA (cytosine1407-C5)-methyltransferase